MVCLKCWLKRFGQASVFCCLRWFQAVVIVLLGLFWPKSVSCLPPRSSRQASIFALKGLVSSGKACRTQWPSKTSNYIEKTEKWGHRKYFMYYCISFTTDIKDHKQNESKVKCWGSIVEHPSQMLNVSPASFYIIFSNYYREHNNKLCQSINTINLQIVTIIQLKNIIFCVLSGYFIFLNFKLYI